jgi:undecaprenyl-diphosphatase
MTLVQSLVLGIVQGLGEFLPISSSAHLILVPWLLGWDDGGLTFDVALHGGTLIALLLFFRKEWIQMGRALTRFRLKNLTDPKSLQNDMELKIALYILLATIPGALIGLLLEKKAEHAFRDPRLVATILAAMGVILWLADRKGAKSLSLENMTLKKALGVGVAQGLAVIPGISRSGVTISTALAQGFDRQSSARFSFFLSMPIIAGACVLKLRHLTGADLTPAFLLGVAVAAVSGYLSIGILIRYLQKNSYGIFAIYRILVGLAVWALVFAGHSVSILG